MIHVSSWITDLRPRGGIEDKEHYLLPISSGYQKGGPSDESDYVTQRPDGRLDYQLIYLQSGQGNFEIGGQAFRATGGQMIVIPPHVPHRYAYSRQEEFSVYWLHCSGWGMAELLQASPLKGRYTLMVGPSRHLPELYRSIMLELQRKEAEYIGVASGLLLQLIYYVLRKRLTLVEAPAHLHDDRIDRSVMLMHEQYMRPWTIEELAARANLCPSRYIHLFTEVHHVSPMRFLNVIRLNKAKEFLGNDSFSVGDVSRMAGFQSAQYFCRFFRRETGMTPTQYRKTME